MASWAKERRPRGGEGREGGPEEEAEERTAGLVEGAGGGEGLGYLEMKGEGGEGKGVTSVDAKADCGMAISLRP